MTIPDFPQDRRRRHKLLTAELARELPPLYSQEDKGDDAIALLKIFARGRFTFYVTEYDGEDTLFGYIVSALGPDCDEWVYASLSELAQTLDAAGVPVFERDQYFEPATVRECLNGHGRS